MQVLMESKMGVLQGQLKAMAISRARAFKIIDGLADPLTEHIAKLITMPTSRDVLHWSNEVSTWMWRIARIQLKPDNRPLKAEQLAQELKATRMAKYPQSYINYFESIYGYCIDTDPAQLQQAVFEVLDEFAELVGNEQYQGFGIKELKSFRKWLIKLS